MIGTTQVSTSVFKFVCSSSFEALIAYLLDAALYSCAYDILLIDVEEEAEETSESLIGLHS